ncbi:actinia tenebrosa protease inhibitors-like [Dermacentor silvarum]|uniref:actinia tenebrosa protease inhibitors-like n=1 Tax=Dermacentor silvarum TaxID=543639 RepID=UPI001896BB37|nr:actinia tenebrosa protease inhibitors-like [Dermacentor silvarum]
MKYCILLAFFGAALAQRNAICRLPVDDGICKALIPRFYFNAETGKCTSFFYGGCEGNENNFETIEECEKTCAEPKRPSDFEGADFKTGCQPAADSGSCNQQLERWYYNVVSGECETFVYGGCGGNENNYESVWECEIACKATYDDHVERLRAVIRGNRRLTLRELADEVGISIGSWRPIANDKLEMCRMKYCILLAFLGAALAQRNAICRLPVDDGICKALIPRFYFNAETGKCTSFFYGGCEGNENNFETIEECEKTCAEPKRPSDFEGADFKTGCQPAADSGSCNQQLERWYYNVVSGECETFVYGGCGGNENNYESVWECEIACKAT